MFSLYILKCRFLELLIINGSKRSITLLINQSILYIPSGNSPWLVVGHPFSQTDQSLVAAVGRQAVPLHQDALVTLGEVQGPGWDTAKVRPKTLFCTWTLIQLMICAVCYLRAGRSARKPCSSNSSGRGFTAERKQTALKDRQCNSDKVEQAPGLIHGLFGIFTDYH